VNDVSEQFNVVLKPAQPTIASNAERAAVPARFVIVVERQTKSRRVLAPADCTAVVLCAQYGVVLVLCDSVVTKIPAGFDLLRFAALTFGAWLTTPLVNQKLV
jgi:hypothetical protein